MHWSIGCGFGSAAGKRYLRRLLIAWSLYVLLLILCLELVKKVPMHGWVLYAVAVIPALPVLAVLAVMGLYVQEETDEYLRMLAMRSLMIASGALLGTIVVNDFLRAIAHGSALGPFVCFIVFFGTYGIAQIAQEMAARGASDA